MRKRGIFIGIILCATVWSCAETKAPEEKEGKSLTDVASSLVGKSGKELFSLTALGTSGKSCHSCHPHGEGLSGVGDKFKKHQELEKMINKCIAGPLKGKELDLASPEMRALAEHLRSL